jgi:hypothetical protein
MFIGTLVAGLILAGPAANATFASAVTATMTAGTHTMAGPTGDRVAASCEPIGNSGKYRLSISVTGHGTVPRATNYILRIEAPGNVITDIPLTNGAGDYEPGASRGEAAGPGEYRYSVEAQYRVPDSTNVWTSAAVQLSVTC